MSRSTDEQALRDIVSALYRAVSAPAGVAPDFEAARPLLHPDARFCRTEPDASGRVVFTPRSVDAYAADVVARVTAPGFFEVEVGHESWIYGHVAHVISRYEAYADESLTLRVKKGANSIQFLRLDAGWRVFSVIWDDEENRLAG